LSLKTWEAVGYKYEHIAAQFNPKSFETQDFILCMDLTNRAIVLNAGKSDEHRAKVFMLRSFDPTLTHIDVTSRQAKDLVVPDPWGDEISSYQNVLEMIERATDGFIASLR
jgi:protein-tyrosine phosphatase